MFADLEKRRCLRIFCLFLEQAVKAGFVTEDNLYLDSTHIKANANKHKFTKMTHDEAKAYQDELEDEMINRQRIEAGKRPFGLRKEVKLKERKISKADPESGYYVKGERENNLLILPILHATTMDLFLAQSSLLEIFMTVKSPFSSSNNRRDFS